MDWRPIQSPAAHNLSAACLPITVKCTYRIELRDKTVWQQTIMLKDIDHLAPPWVDWWQVVIDYDIGLVSSVNTSHQPTLSRKYTYDVAFI